MVSSLIGYLVEWYKDSKLNVPQNISEQLEKHRSN